MGLSWGAPLYTHICSGPECADTLNTPPARHDLGSFLLERKCHSWLADILLDVSDAILFSILYPILAGPTPFYWSCSPHPATSPECQGQGGGRDGERHTMDFTAQGYWARKQSFSPSLGQQGPRGTGHSSPAHLGAQYLSSHFPMARYMQVPPTTPTHPHTCAHTGTLTQSARWRGPS